MQPDSLQAPTKPISGESTDRPTSERSPWHFALRQFVKMQQSPLSITLKWSIYISGLIILGMGLLAWVIIAQQNRAHLDQMGIYGEALVDQLAHTAAEPLMAEDDFALEVLVSRLAESGRVIGVGIYRNDELVATAGISPQAMATSIIPGPQQLLGDRPVRLDWSWLDSSGQYRNALSFFAPVYFQDVTAGHALITLDRDILAEGTRRSIQAIAVATAGLIAVTVVMAFALGRRLGRPLQDLAAASEALKKGDFKHRLPQQRNDEIGLIIDSFNQHAADLSDKQRVEAALSCYVSPHVAQSVLANLEQPMLGGTSIEGSVLFCDIVGYTELSEAMTPSEVAEMLNEYFRYIALAGDTCLGTVDKFIGDCAMVVFGVPEPDPQHALHAVTCAVLIQEVVTRLNRLRVARRLEPVHFRIGVNSGLMLAGNMGAPERMQFTVVGDAVNLASRLCDQALPGQIIVSDGTAGHPGVREQLLMRDKPPILVKGRRQEVTPVEVIGFNGAHQQLIQEVVARLLPTHEAT